jgi:outer membrane protein TolC
MSVAKQLKRTLETAIVLAIVLLMASVGFAESDIAMPEPPPLRPGYAITLIDAIQQADSSNRSLSAVRIDLQAAAAKLKDSWSILLPNLYGNLGYTLRDHADTTELNGVTVETRAQQEATVGLAASLPLINAQRWMTIDAARAQRDLTTLSVEQTRQELLYTVAEAYYQAATLQRLIAVYAAQSRALERHLETAKARFRSGVGSLVDVRRAETDLVAIREQQIKAVFSLEDTRDALALLIASDEPPMPVNQPQPIPAPARTDEPALNERWDLKVAESTVSLADKQLTAQWMQFVPTLSASWQYAYALTTLDTPRAYDRGRWFAGLVLSVPLFDYTFYPGLQDQRAVLRQATLRLEQQQAAARTEVLQAQRAVEQAKHLVATAQTKARLADDTLELAQTNYINGQGSALTVIDAQRSSQTAHVDLETRRFDLELTKLGLFRAIGKDIMLLVQ